MAAPASEVCLTGSIRCWSFSRWRISWDERRDARLHIAAQPVAERVFVLAAAKPALAQGRTVVIYPQGPRMPDCKAGEFRCGAVHFGASLGHGGHNA